jgi:hypothetical protein
MRPDASPPDHTRADAEPHGLHVDLQWDEPDAGCVSCGGPYLTVADHRCGTCLGAPVQHCPHCLVDISALVEREVARRWRETSRDTAEAWTAGRYFDRHRERQRIIAARGAA